MAQAYIKWEARPEFLKQEAERRERENGIHLVRVILPEFDPIATEATIYKKGRQNLKHQELSPTERAMLGGASRGFCWARWSASEIKWVLVSKAEEGESF